MPEEVPSVPETVPSVPEEGSSGVGSMPPETVPSGSLGSTSGWETVSGCDGATAEDGSCGSGSAGAETVCCGCDAIGSASPA